MSGQKILEGMKVAIVATDGFEQSELTDPRAALERAGATISVVAPHGGSIRGFRHQHESDEVLVDTTLEHAAADEFDAVLLPGGSMNADALRSNPDAVRFVKRAAGAGKPIAAICHGPWLLASAGLLDGRTVTSYPTIQDDLRGAGARWENREVVRDGNIVTSRRPADIPAFNRAMIGLFAEHRTR